MAVVHANANPEVGELEAFFPACADNALLPRAVPEDILKEFREAELCAAHSAFRAGSALMRSVLEKTLKASGYTEGSLKAKIELVKADGLITATREGRAQENRELGNDILHDDWREVTFEEFEAARKYAQRFLEDLYDNRPDVEAALIAKGRVFRRPS